MHLAVDLETMAAQLRVKFDKNIITKGRTEFDRVVVLLAHSWIHIYSNGAPLECDLRLRQKVVLIKDHEFEPRPMLHADQDFKFVFVCELAS